MTAADFDNGHLKKTFEGFIESNVIAIANENDTVATEANTFGDNDFLCAKISRLINADMQIILTETDGIYKNMVIKETIYYSESLDIVDYVEDDVSTHGKGGMKSKVDAAILAADTIGKSYSL